MKITGGPSGPLSIIYFFQKKRTDKQTHTQTNKQVRAENSPNKGLIPFNKGPRLNTSWDLEGSLQFMRYNVFIKYLNKLDFFLTRLILKI